MQNTLDTTEVKADTFVCDTPENFYFAIKHLERFKEIADDNEMLLKITATYLPKDS